jgi:hypothetical protein
MLRSVIVHLLSCYAAAEMQLWRSCAEGTMAELAVTVRKAASLREQRLVTAKPTCACTLHKHLVAS